MLPDTNPDVACMVVSDATLAACCSISESWLTKSNVKTY